MVTTTQILCEEIFEKGERKSKKHSNKPKIKFKFSYIVNKF